MKEIITLFDIEYRNSKYCDFSLKLSFENKKKLVYDCKQEFNIPYGRADANA